TLSDPLMRCHALEVDGNVLRSVSQAMEPDPQGICNGYEAGFNNYDLSSMTTSPVIVGYNCSSAPYKITTRGGITFCQYGNIFVRNDNRDPEHPVLPDSGGTVFNGGDVKILGNYLYAANASTNTDPQYQGGLYIYDVTDLVQPPVQIGILPTSTWTNPS